MDLALLVYAISLLTNIQALVFIIASMAVIVAFIMLIYRVTELEIHQYNGEKEIQFKLNKRVGVDKIFWRSSIVAVMLFVVGIAIPSEKTAYTMLGAYAAQKAIENPHTQEIAEKILRVANAKIDQYVEETIASTTKKK